MEWNEWWCCTSLKLVLSMDPDCYRMEASLFSCRRRLWRRQRMDGPCLCFLSRRISCPIVKNDFWMQKTCILSCLFCFEYSSHCVLQGNNQKTNQHTSRGSFNGLNDWQTDKVFLWPLSRNKLSGTAIFHWTEKNTKKTKEPKQRPTRRWEWSDINNYIAKC